MSEPKKEITLMQAAPWIAMVVIGYMLWTKQDASPKPTPDPTPVSVDVRKASHDAAVALVHRMADDIAKVSASKPKTVLEAGTLSVELDEATRDEFKRSLAKFMKPILGTDQMPDASTKLFKDMEAGYRSVR